MCMRIALAHLFTVHTGCKQARDAPSRWAQKCGVNQCQRGHVARSRLRAAQGPLGPSLMVSGHDIFRVAIWCRPNFTSARRWRDANRLHSQGESIQHLDLDLTMLSR